VKTKSPWEDWQNPNFVRVLETMPDAAKVTASGISDEGSGHGCLLAGASHGERSELGEKCTLVGEWCTRRNDYAVGLSTVCFHA
jgi:hypothetical protein